MLWGLALDTSCTSVGCFLKVCGDGVEYPVSAIDGPGGVANNGWWAID
jgi:hypothetical protein